MGVLNNIAAGLARRAARLNRVGRIPVRRSNRAARVLVDAFDFMFGRGTDTADPQSYRYGSYYSSSAAIHAAIRIRAAAVSTVPLRVEERTSGVWRPASETHPLAALLRSPNPFWTPAELLRATETYLLLWGAAFWGIERNETGAIGEVWPLRPDRMKVLPDEREYVRGFVYENMVALGDSTVAYLPDEIAWFRHFNPNDEFTGISSVAPVLTTIEMAAEAASFNRNFFANSATPGDIAITTDQTPTEEEAEAFLTRWEERFRGTRRSHRPILLSRGMDLKRMGLSHRDMEFIAGLKWSVEEVSRVFGVPKAFLADLTEATLANINAEERFFWRNTILPELRLISDELNRSLTPRFGSPSELRIVFDTGAIDALKESENDRVERLVSLVGAGVMTVNEARAREQLDPVAWGDGPDHGSP